ncbi:capsular biosynthesis protein [Leeia aquatica]|uniref:Capsular biosynthesis protein n=1 Tax=Leeia aquatica TaxID=2725557 RepID=A0A847S822_9NEIS|nr:capsular biosynthesis protein [Leeia aquatica]NLR75015.1 capsular biosynthesis protein [Leeia aquatica]
MKRIIIDLDSTLCYSSGEYQNAEPNLEVIDKVRAYRALGFEIVVYTSRNMRTFQGNVGKINIHTLPVILEWLNKHNVEYDEVLVGKPWCGTEGFYVDDRAIRPDEFARLSPEQVNELLRSSNKA